MSEVTDWDYLKTEEQRRAYLDFAISTKDNAFIAEAMVKSQEAKKMRSVKREPKNG